VIELPHDATVLYDALRRAHAIGTGIAIGIGAARIVIATPPYPEGLRLAVLDPLRRATR